MAEPDTDFPSFNPDDPTVDLWRTPREDLQGDRPPGLIDLNRYPFGLASHGIATFLQRPVALTPADLRAAEVDVAMVGAGIDLSFGMRGAAFGPRALRSHDMYLPTVASGFPHQHTRVDALADLVIADAGSMPFIIGGDHSLMYPDVAALADVYAGWCCELGLSHGDMPETQHGSATGGVRIACQVHDDRSTAVAVPVAMPRETDRGRRLRGTSPQRPRCGRSWRK